jgi:hypothetical protein
MDYNFIKVSLKLVWDYLNAQHLHPVLCTVALTFIFRLTPKLINLAIAQIKMDQVARLIIQAFIELLISIQLFTFLRTALAGKSFLWIKNLGEQDIYLSAIVASMAAFTVLYLNEFKVKKIFAVFSSPSAPVVIITTLITVQVLLTANAATLISILSGIIVSRVLSLLFPAPAAMRMQ